MSYLDNAPFGETRPRSVMIIQHAIWYLSTFHLDITPTREAIKILYKCLPQKNRRVTV